VFGAKRRQGRPPGVAYLGARGQQRPVGHGRAPDLQHAALPARTSADVPVWAWPTPTDRGDGYNRVLGVDAHVVWRKIWFSAGAGRVPRTRGQGAARAGKLWTVTFGDRTGRAYATTTSCSGVQRTSRYSGFVNRTDFVAGRTLQHGSFYGRPARWFEHFTAIVGFAPIWRLRDFGRLNRTIETRCRPLDPRPCGAGGVPGHASTSPLRVSTARTTRATPWHTPFAVRTTCITSPAPRFHFWNAPNRAVSGSVVLGTRQWRSFPRHRGPPGRVDTVAALRPTPALRLEARWVHQRSPAPRGRQPFSTANIPAQALSTS